VGRNIRPGDICGDKGLSIIPKSTGWRPFGLENCWGKKKKVLWSLGSLPCVSVKCHDKKKTKSKGWFQGGEIGQSELGTGLLRTKGRVKERRSMSGHAVDEDLLKPIGVNGYKGVLCDVEHQR